MDRLSIGLESLAVVGLILSLTAVWINRKTRNLEWKLGCWGAVVSIAMLCLSIAKDIKDAKEAAASAAQLDSLTKRADKAESELVEAKKQAAETEWRLSSRTTLLTAPIRKRLIERLKEFPARSVDLIFDTNVNEAGDFGVTMSEILADAGCHREQKDVKVLGGNAGVTGIWVLYFGDAPGQFPTKLHDALVEAGLPGVRYTPTGEQFTEGGRHKCRW